MKETAIDKNSVVGALLVFVLDQRDRTFLMLNDPAGLEQALKALKKEKLDAHHKKLLKDIEDELKAWNDYRRKPGRGRSQTFVVGIQEGQFTVRCEGDLVGKCELQEGPLARLLARAGYHPKNENHILMHSSSIDFPEEDGAPERFDAHRVLRDAVMLATRLM